MRRADIALLLACTCAGALPAAAQVIRPPNIKGPIEAARKAAGATNAQVQGSQKTGEGTTAARPAEAMQAGGKTAPAATSAKQGAKLSTADSAKAAAAADSASHRGSASQSGGKGIVTFYREEFFYDSKDRRDPFLSLLATGELKPLLADLALIGVLYDNGAPNRSVAVLEDASNKDTYRLKVGQVVGRMRVVKIGPQEITFSIDEFGFSRQETILIDISRKTGGQPGRRPQ